MGFLGRLTKPNIAQLYEKRDIKGLIDALKYKSDEKIRREAAVALGTLMDTRSIEPLISALNDSDWRVSDEAGQALVRIGSPAVNPLLSALQNPDYKIQGRVADTLGIMREHRAVEPLIRLLETDNGYLASIVIKALGNIRDSRAVDPLIVLLRDADRPRGIEIIDALKKIGDPSAAGPLLCVIENQYPYKCHPDVRRNAAIALGSLTRSNATNALHSALYDSDKEVRRGAARGLGETGDPHAFDPLITDLKNPDFEIRMRAAEAFGTIEEPAFTALYPLLSDSDEWISGEIQYWVRCNNGANLSQNSKGYVYITAILLYKICTQPSDNNKILPLMIRLLNTGSSSSHEDCARLKETVLGSDDKGFLTLIFCSLDAFALRPPTFPAIWYPLLEIAHENPSPLIFRFIERVVNEGSDLVKGYPPDPIWIRGRTKPHITRNGEYGWADDIWMDIVSSGARFLRDNMSLIPENLSEMYRMNALNACIHKLNTWEDVKKTRDKIDVFKVNSQIAYWKQLSEYFDGNNQSQG